MADIEVTVESGSENQIVEINYDGQEQIQLPMTQGEHLSKQAAKLNFNETAEELEEQAADPDGGEDTSDTTETPAAPAKWPWESVRDHLRDALAEVSVLSDVISIATKECGRDAGNNPKRYMILDGPTIAESPEQKPYVSLLAKKRALDGHVAKILTSGADHLKSLQSENKTAVGEDNRSSNFHFELLKLRQHWRLKKVSNTILGDLSFRTAGSHFKQSGLFEVMKSDGESSASASTTGTTGSADSGGPQTKSVLRVNVPSELEGIAFIQVVIQKESEQLVNANLCQSGAFSASKIEDVHWQKKLEQAQNVIFCQELFAQLAKEAIQFQGSIPHLVVGNQISCSLYPDIQLLITLQHQTGTERKGLLSQMQNGVKDGRNESNGAGAKPQQTPPQPAKDHSHVLEHSLHQLLRKAHKRNLNPEHGGLSSLPVGVSKKRRLAGPRAADRKTLLKMANEETFLEQILLQAQHVVMRLRTMYVLDTMASGHKDPLITFHWSTLSSPTRTSVKVIVHIGIF